MDILILGYFYWLFIQLHSNTAAEQMTKQSRKPGRICEGRKNTFSPDHKANSISGYKLLLTLGKKEVSSTFKKEDTF